MSDEFSEVNKHRLHVGGNQNAPVLCCKLQYLGIRGAVRDDADVAFKIDVWFPAAEAPPDVGIKVRIGLERDLQAIFETFPLRARSNGSSISGDSG